MKKLFFLFILISNALCAQVFKVGDINCNYKPVNHNYTVTCPQYTTASESYTLDFDADLVSDMNISSSCQWYFHSTTGWANIQKIYVSPSSGYQVVSDGMGGIIKLAYGTTLNNSLGFMPTGGYLFGSPSNPYYIGFRKILTSDTIYGWVNVDYSSFPGAIKSYGYKMVSDNTNPTIYFTNTQTVLCTGESLTLTAQPVGGTFSGTDVSGNVFSPTNSGTQQTVYTYTNSTGCNVNTTQLFTVNACVGINELYHGDVSIRIFPNPNNGAFEIKGIKEETIFISNELGQLISTKNLTQENSYSVKLSDLQSGIYFVGNKFYRQKVVVIK